MKNGASTMKGVIGGDEMRGEIREKACRERRDRGAKGKGMRNLKSN